MTDRSCDFCEIVARRLPGQIVFEDELTMSFLDITAVTEGHTLVIPKAHFADIWEVPEESAVAVMRTAHRVAARIRDVLAPEGLTLFQANRPVGWQDVFHLHLHLVPRWPGDRLTRPWTAAPVEPATLSPVRSRLALDRTPVTEGDAQCNPRTPPPCRTSMAPCRTPAAQCRTCRTRTAPGGAPTARPGE